MTAIARMLHVMSGVHSAVSPRSASSENRPKPVSADLSIAKDVGGNLDAVVGREDAVTPMHADRGDDHHGQHERRADGAEKAGGDENATR